MNLAIIGTGYVGLVTGTCFAEKGNNVICVDNDSKKLEILNKGKVPIYEPGLEDLVIKNLKSKNLSFTSDLEFAIKNSDIIFFCLPTPTLEDGTSDTKYVFEVAEQIGQYFNAPKIIINKSTVPIGTTQKIVEILSQNTSLDFTVVSNPEFLREGYAVEDFMKPDRIVIGLENNTFEKVLRDLYNDFITDPSQIKIMDSRSSEMAKYAANSFLAMKITFINEIANLCEKLGANIDFVKDSIGSDPRIGNRFLNPGIGFGGSCFPKDVKALLTTSQTEGYDFKLLNSTVEANQHQIERFIKKITTIIKQKNLPKSIALWGLSFKANTDDIRKSQAIEIVTSLLKQGYQISAYDPKASDNFKKFYPEIKIDIRDNLYDTLDSKSLLVIATEWEEFVKADLKIVKSRLKNPIIVDGRNLFDLKNSNLQDFEYFSIGRGEQNLFN
jgi:UDPglucose 6-dehydrogenase